MVEKIGIFVSKDEFSKIAIDQLISMGYKPVLFSFKKTGFPEEIVLKFGDIENFMKCVSMYSIKKIVFAGKINARDIFKKNMAQSGIEFLKATKDLCPEKILKNLVKFITENGIELMSLTEVFRRYIAEEKIYTNIKPDESQWKDILFGWNIAKNIAHLGIGQAVAVKNGMVIAVEGIEGTDKMIERAGRYSKDFTIVKVIKDNQDIRFDLPTIGKKTIENLIRAGGKVLAIEAGKTIMLEPEIIINIADRNNLIIAGITGKEIMDDY